MKTIKIFAFPTHGTLERTSGVDFARVIQPMEHLNGYNDGEVTFKVKVFDVKKDKNKQNWLHIAKNYDIIYFNYLNDPWGFAAMGAMARGYGRKMVLDIDDAIWNIKSDNTAYAVYKKGSESIQNFSLICNEVDYITCTNDYLKHVIMNNTTKKADKIKVFPNYVDLSLYSHKAKFNNDGQIILTHFGSSSHYQDLLDKEFMNGVDKIMAEYPNVILRFVGAFIPAFRQRWGSRYENVFGDVDIYRWIKGPFKKYMDETDILVVPLTDDIYNRSKSSIKFIEASSARVPGVYQNIRQYSEIIEPGVNGYLAKKDTDWYKAIKEMIDDAKKRKSVGEAAFKTIKEEWQMKDHVKDYAEFFKSVV